MADPSGTEPQQEEPWVASQRKTFSKWLLARLSLSEFPNNKQTLEEALNVKKLV